MHREAAQPARSDGLLTIAIGVTAVYVVGRLALPLAGHDAVDAWRLAVGLPIFALSAVLVVRASRGAGEARLGWLLLAAGMALYPIGTISAALHGAADSAPPIAHTAWLAFYVCAYAGVARLAHAAVRPFPSAFLLDGIAIVLACGAAIATVAAIAGAAPYPIWEAALGLAYPALDLVLLAYIVWVGSVTGGPAADVWRRLVEAFAVLLAADLLFVALAALSALSDVALYTAAYPVVMLLIARAAHAPPAPPAPLVLDTRTAVALPAAAVAVVVGVLVAHAVTQREGPAIALVVAALVVLGLRVFLLQRAAAQLAQTRRFERGFDEAGVGMGIADLGGRWVRVNSALAGIFGRSPEELVGEDVIEQVEGDRRTAARAVRAQLLRGAQHVEPMHLRITVPGDTRDVHLTGDLVQGDEAPQFFVQLRDVTLERRARRHADAVSAISRQALALDDLDELLARAVPRLLDTLEAELVAWVPLDGADDPVVAVSAGELADGVLDDVRAGGSILLGGGEDSSVVIDDARAIELGLPHVHRAGLGHVALIRVQPRAAGRAVLCVAHEVAPERDHDETVFLDTVANVLATAADRAYDERASRHRALHDPLTGLANRALLSAHLSQAIASGRREGGSVAVLLIDLDRFKLVNDTLGHEIGDGLLRGVADRLSRHTREGDLLARLGGDEFVLVVSRARDARDVEAAAARIVAALDAPIEVGGRELRVGASTGVAIMPADFARPDALLHEADVAMYRAKRAGGSQWARAASITRSQVEQRDDLEHDLRAAVKDGGLRLALQPQIELGGAPRLVGYEALVRWARPGHGLLYPEAFVPLAATLGLLGDIGDWVVAQGLAHLAGAPGADDARLSINLFPEQLVPGLPERIDRLTAAAGVGADRLIVEVPAATLVTDEAAMDIVERLRDRDVGVVLEDFGTGWTSLPALQRHAVDALKLDRSLVGRLPDSPAATTVARSCVRVAEEFGIDVIAAGVERAEQLAAVRDLGIRRIQGHLVAPPLMPEDAEEYARAGRWGEVLPG